MAWLKYRTREEVEEEERVFSNVMFDEISGPTLYFFVLFFSYITRMGENDDRLSSTWKDLEDRSEHWGCDIPWAVLACHWGSCLTFTSI